MGEKEHRKSEPEPSSPNPDGAVNPGSKRINSPIDFEAKAMARAARMQSKPMPMRKRAFLYGRVSGKIQAEEDKASFPEQFAEMESLCAREDWEIVGRERDIGPGWSKHRAGFQRILKYCEEGVCDIIVCWKSDRLSRGMYPAAALMEVVEAHNIEVVSVTDTIDMNTFGIYAVVGKIELDNLKQRTAMGRRGAAKMGRIPCNGLPYGYRIGEDGKPEIVECEAEVVARVFDLYVYEGLGIKPIGAMLTEEQVPTARGKGTRWHDSHLSRMLGQEAYKGVWWYGRSRQISTPMGRRRYDQPEETWIPVPVPAIIDVESWNEAQRLKEVRKSRSKRNTKVEYMVQHLVRCEVCEMLMGGRATKQNTVKRGGRTYVYEIDPPRRYYRCYGMQQRLTNCREPKFIRAELLEDLIWDEVAGVLRQPERITSSLGTLTAENGSELIKEIAAAELKVKESQEEDDRAITLFVTGRIDQDQLDRQREVIAVKLQHRTKRLEALRGREAMAESSACLSDDIDLWAKKVSQGLEKLTFGQRKEILEQLVEGATIDGDNKVTITLAIPGELVVAEQQATNSRGRLRCRKRG